MEIQETTNVENNDCQFVDIGGAEQSLSHENRSRKFFNSVSLPSAEVVFFTQVCFIFILLSLSISKLSFYNLTIGIDNSSLDKHLKHFKFLEYMLYCMTQRDISKKKIIPVLGTHMFCLVQ